MVSKYVLKIKKLYDNCQKILFYTVDSTLLITETVVLLLRPFLNSTTPSANANKVKSFPTPTFLPG